VDVVDEVSKFIDFYTGADSSSLIRKMMFSAYKYKIKVKPDQDRKFDPVFYNKAFKKYQAELFYTSDAETDQDFMQNAHQFMPFDEEVYLLKALVNQTESDATNFISKLKGTTWQLPPEFEAVVKE
jgi:hypothetical protein